MKRWGRGGGQHKNRPENFSGYPFIHDHTCFPDFVKLYPTRQTLTSSQQIETDSVLILLTKDIFDIKIFFMEKGEGRRGGYRGIGERGRVCLKPRGHLSFGTWPHQLVHFDLCIEHLLYGLQFSCILVKIHMFWWASIHAHRSWNHFETMRSAGCFIVLIWANFLWIMNVWIIKS